MTFTSDAFEPSPRKPAWLDPAAESLLTVCGRDARSPFEITIDFPACAPESLHHFRWLSIHNQLTEPERLSQLRRLTVRIPCAVHDADTSRIQATIEDKLPRLSALDLLFIEFVPLA
jgi:hypothetical protein